MEPINHHLLSTNQNAEKHEAWRLEAARLKSAYEAAKLLPVKKLPPGERFDLEDLWWADFPVVDFDAIALL